MRLKSFSNYFGPENFFRHVQHTITLQHRNWRQIRCCVKLHATCLSGIKNQLNIITSKNIWLVVPFKLTNAAEK